MTTTNPTQSESLRDIAYRLWHRLQVRGSKHVVAVFVTPHDVVWCRIDTRDYALLVSRHGHNEIGRYNSRVAFDDLLDDVLHAARACGWVDA